MDSRGIKGFKLTITFVGRQSKACLRLIIHNLNRLSTNLLNLFDII